MKNKKIILSGLKDFIVIISVVFLVTIIVCSWAIYVIDPIVSKEINLLNIIFITILSIPILTVSFLIVAGIVYLLYGEEI